MDLAASSSEPDSSYSEWSSDGSSYGYSSSLASVDSEELVRVNLLWKDEVTLVMG